MMRVLVMSDSHGRLSEIRLAARAAGEIDCALHLGDFAGDARVLANLLGVPVHAVRGNCDAGFSYETEKVLTLGGARIFMTHGHLYGVKTGTWALAEHAGALGCAAALYGHTHVSDIAAQGPMLLVNPGSPSRPASGRKRSIAVLEIENGDVRPGIITF